MLYKKYITVLFVFFVIVSSHISLVYSLKTPAKNKADRVVVHKGLRVMELWRGCDILKTYKIALGGLPRGPKTEEGDQKTLEGSYVFDWRNPKSAFYKSIHISYPNAKDRAQAQKRGVRAGGDIFLHGIGKKWGFLGASHALHDWTLGCIAVTNEEMDEIWDAVPNGTPLIINP